MTFGEVDRVSQFDDATQEVRPHAEALDNAGDLLSPRSGPPKAISRGGFPGGFAILNDLDFCGRLRDCRAICDFRNLLVVALIRRHGLHPFRTRRLWLVCEPAEARRPAIRPKATQLQASPYVEYPRQPESAGEQLCAIMQKHYASVFTLRYEPV